MVKLVKKAKKTKIAHKIGKKKRQSYVFDEIRALANGYGLELFRHKVGGSNYIYTLVNSSGGYRKYDSMIGVINAIKLYNRVGVHAYKA
jgi:hypothetical protein